MVLKDLRKQVFNYFLILGISITLIFSFIAYFYIKAHIIDNAENNLKLYANLAGQIVEQKNEVLFTYLEGIEKYLMDENPEGDINKSIDYLQYISQNNEHFMMIGIADDKGMLYFPSIYRKGFQVLDISKRTYYKEAMKGKRSIMSPSRTLNPELNSEIIVAYALPINYKNNVSGAIVAISDIDFLYRLIEDIKFGENGYSYMVDSNGQTIAHPKISYLEPDFNVLEEGIYNERYYSVSKYIKRAILDESGVGEYEFDGKFVYSGYSKVKGTNWTVFILAFKSEVLKLLYPLSLGILIMNFAVILSGAIIYRKIRKRILIKDKEIKRERDSLEYEAAYDELTNVYNRRYGLTVLNDRLKLANRNNDLFTIAYIDIDNLKITNDKIGHIEGDRLIRTISNVFVNNLRKSDFISRLGGDEFLVGFYNCDLENAENILNKIQIELDNKFLDLGFEFPLLFSYGLALYDENIHESLDSLIKEADEKMYIHKKQKNKK